MRIRTISGAVIVLALALAGILRGLFPNFGGGDGNGEGAGNGQQPAVQTPEEPDEAPASDVASVDRERPEVLTILIEDRQFAIRQANGEGGDWNRMELERVVELARQTSGNADGVRVRIVRDESARASAEIELQDRLERAGLPKDSIVMAPELIRRSD